MNHKLVLGLIGLIVCCGLSSPAGAVPKPQRYPGLVGGFRPERPTTLVVRDERAAFDCFQEGQDCTFEVIYHIWNPGDEVEEVLAGFYTIRAAGVAVTLDGNDLVHPLTPEEGARLDAVEQEQQPEFFAEGFFATVPPDLQDRIGRFGIPLSLQPGQVAELVVRGVVTLSPSFRPSWLRSAVQTRHLLLASHPDDQILDLDYLMTSTDGWAATGSLEVIVRHPESWLFRGGVVVRPEPYSELVPVEMTDVWSETEDGDVLVASATIGTASGSRLSTSFTQPASHFSFGGVLVGLGGALDDSGGFRMRFGLEVAAPDWLLYSLNVDTDWSERFMLTPTVVAATRSPMFLPIGFGIGLGMPIEVLDEVEIGVRAQVDMILGPLGFVTSFDIFPGLPSEDPDRLQVVMMGQLSL